MGKRNKIHFSEARPDPLFLTACGSLEVTATNQIELVTCKRCLKRLRKQEAPIVQELVQTLTTEVQARQTLIDPDSGLPFLTPATYRHRSCTCGGCPVCKHVAMIAREQHVAPWSDRPRLHLQRTARWPSVNAALVWFADQCDDGFPQQSLGAALEQLGKVGTMVQGGASRDTQAIQDADDRVTVERALLICTDGEPDIDRVTCLWILFAAAVGRRDRDKKGRVVRVPTTDTALGADTGQSAQAVGNAVKRMKRRLYAALRVSGSVLEVKR